MFWGVLVWGGVYKFLSAFSHKLQADCCQERAFFRFLLLPRSSPPASKSETLFLLRGGLAASRKSVGGSDFLLQVKPACLEVGNIVSTMRRAGSQQSRKSAGPRLDCSATRLSVASEDSTIPEYNSGLQILIRVFFEDYIYVCHV
jgi:hypothetical protein